MEKPKKLKLTDYEFLQTIGIGNFSRVKLAKNKLNNKYYAVKVFKKSEILKNKYFDALSRENTILWNVRHPFIANAEGFC